MAKHVYEVVGDMTCNDQELKDGDSITLQAEDAELLMSYGKIRDPKASKAKASDNEASESK